MEFFTKTLGSLSFSSSAFTLDTPVVLDSAYPSIWTVHQGTAKKDKTPVTVFQFDGSLLENSRRQPLAENMLRQLRKLRLPGMLRIIDSEQSGTSILIATERVIPIYSRLPDLSPDAKLWGLQTLLTTLHNLHSHIKCAHGNINIGSVFENASGEWVLGGFEIASILTDTESMFSYGSLLPAAAGSADWVPPEISKQGWGAAATKDPQLVDSYEFGRIITTVLASSGGKIPPPVARLAQSLVAPVRRASIEAAAKQSTTFHTPLSDITEAASSIVIMNDFDLMKLLNLVDTNAEKMPPAYLGSRVFPELAKATSTGRGGLEAVRILIRLTALLREPQFEVVALPYLVHSFSSMDRAVRLEILKALPTFIESVPDKVVQGKFMPAMAPGFTDKEALIRQESLRAVAYLAPKLSSRQLNDELLRLLARTNADRDAGIRAQTILLLSQISRLLSPSNRSTVIVAALAKAFKDTDVLVKRAALQALDETAELFNAREAAERLLGPAASAMLDSEWEVRAQARKIVNAILERVTVEANRLDEGLEGGVPPTERHATGPLSLFSNTLGVPPPIANLTGTVASKQVSPAPAPTPTFSSSAKAAVPTPPAAPAVPASFAARAAPAASAIVHESAVFGDEEDEVDADGWGAWGDEPAEGSRPLGGKAFGEPPKASGATLSLEPDEDDPDGWEW